MRGRSKEDLSTAGHSGPASRLVGLLAVGCVLLVLIAVFIPRRVADRPEIGSTDHPAITRNTQAQDSAREGVLARLPKEPVAPALSAEEIVATKMAQFARNGRNLARAMAEHFNKSFPAEFDRFFAAAEAGRYDEMSAIYRSLRAQRESGADKSWYGPHWRALVETQGAADAVHDWPAQKLLDYGEAVLNSLRPGMIYAGGTDPGCFIPTLLNDTSEGEHHIVVTQNALADRTYLDYVNFLHGERMTTLTQDDSEKAFQEYMTDARKRYEHDQQFPSEPKQLRPGEEVRMVDNKFQVSGQVAVMSINERLFQTLMQKNPDVSFGMEESFPFKSTYATANALPLGPIMELGAQNDAAAFTPERAAQSVDYWRTTVQQVFSDTATPQDSDPRKAYSKLISSQAGLLLDRNFTAQAEEAFRIANEVCPSSPEAVYRYVNMLVEQKRIADAMRVGQNAVQAAPDNKQFAELLTQLGKMNGK